MQKKGYYLMEIYSKNDTYILYQGNMLDMLDDIEENSIDCIITDPPYELNFMNKGWDNAGVSFQKETWEKCLKVLKPGGYLLSFSGSRTSHRITCAIEDAGFEIRDTIMWLYGSGFPKSMNVGLAIDKKLGVESKTIGVNQNILIKQKKDLETGHRKIVDSYNSGAEDRNNGFKNTSADIKEPVSDIGKQFKGYGTSLKPSYEPIIIARKPFKVSLVDNIMKYGVGGLNIDECRIEHNEELKTTNRNPKNSEVFNVDNCGFDNTKNHIASANPDGRFPANTILTYDETDFEEVCGGFPYTKSTGGSGEKSISGGLSGKVYQGGWLHDKVCSHLGGLGDSGSASRYFYCAKASKRDRNDGCENINNHPTVKPTSLMQYLVRLVAPKGSVILDPFNGSGSTGKAVLYENKDRQADYKYIGIDLSEEYLEISKQRLDYVLNNDV